MSKIPCKTCSKEFEPHQKYCSNACRLFGFRNGIVTKKPKTETIALQKEVVETKVLQPKQKWFNTAMCKKHSGSMKGTCGCE